MTGIDPNFLLFAIAVTVLTPFMIGLSGVALLIYCVRGK